LILGRSAGEIERAEHNEDYNYISETAGIHEDSSWWHDVGLGAGILTQPE
jgi:hypothetical protein